jgi:hypothetical protein
VEPELTAFQLSQQRWFEKIYRSIGAKRKRRRRFLAGAAWLASDGPPSLSKT